MNFKTFLEMVNKSDIPAYLRKNDKMTTKDLEKERTKNRSHPETIKKINGTVQEEVLDESVFADKEQAQAVASKLKKQNDDGNYSVVADHGKHRVVHSYHSDSRVKKDIAKLNEEQLDEANHREFASQGKMHPDMAKHMKTGEHMDYYEPKTGDKVHGKVMKNDGKEVHVKQTHDSYDPKKVGTVHKFTIASKLEEGYYEKPASAYRRKGDEIGGGSSKNDVPFDGPYTKTKANVKDKSGAVHSAMSRAKHLAKQAMNKQKNEEVELEESNPHKSVAAEIKAGTFKSYSPVAPVPDKKYIKGTPEHKAYKATKKPINGMPTNVKEALKGDQHKIDKNKNGKIDAHDFKLLRKEEAEQIDEVNQKTVALAKEIAKKHRNMTSDVSRGNVHIFNKHDDEAADRLVLSHTGTDKEGNDRFHLHRVHSSAEDSDHRNLTAAEVHKHAARHITGKIQESEQLDELSKGTLGSYIKKASNDLANKGAALGKKQADADEVDRYTNRHMPNQSDERERMRKAVGASHDDINKVRSGAIKRNKNIGKAVDRLSKEEFENGELETMSKSYKQFVESLNEIKMSDLPSRKVSGSSYGAQYHDAEGDDEEEKPKAKPAVDAVKRGRGRPAGSKSGARQSGSAAKTKNGADYTGYKLHLPNKN
jgi:hypothetical protein